METFWFRQVTAFVLLVLGCPVAAVSDQSCNFPAIFNFGDSNSDTGGITAMFGEAAHPNGVTFFHAPAGRFSDGRLTIDFMAESLGLPYLSPYLDSIGSNFTHGANFAISGSTILPQLLQAGKCPISLAHQSDEFSAFRYRSQIARQKGGVFGQLLPGEDVFNKSLYTFDIGQNDLVTSYELNMTTDQVKAAVVPELIVQLSNAIKSVYAQGGRSFWVHNTGPVGCLPYVMDTFLVKASQVDEYGCASPYNDVPKHFNTKLKELVYELRQSLPLASITYVDVYSLKYELITEGEKFGFEKPFVTCCGDGGKYNYSPDRLCGSTSVVNGKEVLIGKSCKDPSVKVIWDGVHFTEATHKWIFEKIVNGSFSDPPVPLKMACHAKDT